MVRPLSYKKKLCLFQLSMKFSLLMNMKLPTNVGIHIHKAEKTMLSQIEQETNVFISNLRLFANKVSCSAELTMKLLTILGQVLTLYPRKC